MVINKLREIREEKGLSQEKLAQACDLSRNTIFLIENGEVNPTANTILRIAEALGVDVTEIFILQK